jgi:hypothetical protein
MSNSFHHAQSSARKWGGEAATYLPIHELIDGSKRAFGDVRHRALLHNTWGVWICQEVFGTTISIGHKQVPVREIAERHIEEDLGFIPSPGDWLQHMNLVTWMGGKQHKFVGREDIVVKEGKP